VRKADAQDGNELISGGRVHSVLQLRKIAATLRLAVGAVHSRLAAGNDINLEREFKSSRNENRLVS
jgi:hypothetical protein